MNVKYFTILFIILIGYVILLNFIVEGKEIGLTFWSNKTREFFAGGSKTIIDHNAYITEYNLKEGWIKIYTNLTEVVAICDPFSGSWFKTMIKKGENNITLPFKPQPYAGLRLVTVSSPWGFAVIKEKEDVWSWWDYPIIILRSEMAKWSWERSAYALSLFVVGLALSRHMKKDRLIVSCAKHLIVIIFVVIVLFAILSMRYETTTVKINQTVRQIPHLIFDTYYIKEWYNYVFGLCFTFGYFFGLWLWTYNKLYVAYVGYNRPIRLHVYPYDTDRKIIRDFDGKLALLQFKNDLRQFINFELNGYNVNGILAVGEENIPTKDKTDYLDLEGGKIVVKKNNNNNFKLGLSIVSFFGFMALCIIADYLHVFKIDLPYAIFFAVVIAIVTNLEGVRSWLGFRVEKIKVIECSRLMDEENYVRMLKEAEIEHLTKEYDKLFVEFAKLGTMAKARAVKLLAGAGRIVKKELEKLKKEIEKEVDKNGEDN